MFTRLLKHEIKATGRIMPFVYLAMVVMLAGNMLVQRMELAWLSGLLLVLLILLSVAVVLLTYVLVITRYYRHLYGKEGYLTQCLPVRPGQLYASKLLVATGWLLLSFLLSTMVMLLIISRSAADSGLSLGGMAAELLRQTGLSAGQAVALVSAVFIWMLLEMVYALAQIYFSISLGCMSRFHNLGIAAPIIFYLVLNFLLQMALLAAMLFVPLGLTYRDGGIHLIGRGMISMILHPEQYPFVFGLGSLLFVLLALAGLIWGTRRMLARHTSLR